MAREEYATDPDAYREAVIAAIEELETTTVADASAE